MVFNTQTQEEIASVCEAGVDSYIKARNKEIISNRIDEGLMGASFVSALYLLYAGLNKVNLKMVFAPFVAGGFYALMGRRQAKNNDSEARLAFEKVCSNMREDDDDES